MQDADRLTIEQMSEFLQGGNGGKRIQPGRGELFFRHSVSQSNENSVWRNNQYSTLAKKPPVQAAATCSDPACPALPTSLAVPFARIDPRQTYSCRAVRAKPSWTSILTSVW